MKLQTFTANTAAEAVEQIRAQLGDEAVVVNVRKIQGNGLARLWTSPRIEVVACVPETPPVPPTPAADPLSEIRRSLDELREQVRDARSHSTPPPTNLPEIAPAPSVPDGRLLTSEWRLGAILSDAGMLPALANRVLQTLEAIHGRRPPTSPMEEIRLAGKVLKQLWEERACSAPELPTTEVRHVLVGVPGAGKSTALCKWLTQEVLLQGKPARLWRIDGQVANTAEFLEVHAEILGVSTGRIWNGPEPVLPGGIEFVDLPGIPLDQPEAFEGLRRQVESLQPCQVHLVLNAAYETSLLLGQVRAFRSIPLAGLILTHVDEDRRWGKIWNLAWGTNCTVRFLSGGQNIPGEFRPVEVAQLLSSVTTFE